MFKVPNGQDPYSAIGKYIRDHITAIEDIIAVIKIDDITTNQLFMIDMNEENCFIWNNDWYEGEKDVALIDFFPVSEAINPSSQPEQRWIPCSERLPDMWDERYLVSLAWGGIGVMEYKSTGFHNYGSFRPVPIESIIAWMTLPAPYRAERREG